MPAMQIALFSNPSRIYLVGCDAASGHFTQPKNITQDRVFKREKDIAIAVSSDRVIDIFVYGCIPKTRKFMANASFIKTITKK